ncbi:hypothetical protein EI77_01095 [Prosthecobacter fusiformis]|uniref:Uncharacterized protein n=1 Tax=Prosthecobacter fusiformis TaxID=48464 RepID=A0A4R7SSM8_9BACT|nr:hypothetical protein [Prosthecobacter fusiformis]TDU81785.1 hypothetical protein EI77_01095 [Prosthecobacter fusiformis]
MTKMLFWPFLWVSAGLVSCETLSPKERPNWLPLTQSYPESAYQKSIHHYDWKVDPDITNAECYEQFKFELPHGIKRLSLPSKAVVYRLQGREVIGQLKKILSSAGHTDKPISIADYRPKMGIVAKISRGTLHLSAYGAQDSFEGGTYVMLLIGVPEGVKVHFATDRTDEQHLETLIQEGWWPVSTAPALKRNYDRILSDAKLPGTP